MKIIYNGGRSPCKIRVGGRLFDHWVRGEIRDVDSDVAMKLLKNSEFEEVKSTVKNKKEVEKESDESFDIEENIKESD